MRHACCWLLDIMRPPPMINWSIVEKQLIPKQRRPEAQSSLRWRGCRSVIFHQYSASTYASLNIEPCVDLWLTVLEGAHEIKHIIWLCQNESWRALSLNLNRRLFKFKRDGDDQRGISFPPHIKDRCVFDTSALTRHSRESKISDLSWFNLFRCGISGMNIHVERYSWF